MEQAELNIKARGPYIAVNKGLVRLLGLQEAAVLCELASKSYYFRAHNKLTKDGYFFCTVSELERSTGIKQKTQQRIIKRLKEKKLIDYFLMCKPYNSSRVRFFRIQEEQVTKLMQEGQNARENQQI